MWLDFVLFYYRLCQGHVQCVIRLVINANKDAYTELLKKRTRTHCDAVFSSSAENGTAGAASRGSAIALVYIVPTRERHRSKPKAIDQSIYLQFTVTILFIISCSSFSCRHYSPPAQSVFSEPKIALMSLLTHPSLFLCSSSSLSSDDDPDSSQVQTAPV